MEAGRGGGEGEEEVGGYSGRGVGRRGGGVQEGASDRKGVQCDSDPTVRLLLPLFVSLIDTDPLHSRSVPMLKTGPHLARSTGAVAPPTSFQALVPRPPRSQYLTYSHLIFGPELLHLHDFLRLSPSVDLDPLVARQRMPKTAFPTTLIMRLGSLYRSGAPASSPLIAKGLVFEQVEIPPSAATLKAITQTGDLELLWKPVAADHLSDPSLLELPSSYYQNLPLPLPFHRWRLLAPPRSAAAAASTSSISALETSVLFSPSIAGRFYPLSPSTGTLPVRADPRLVQKVLAEAERGVHWWTHKKGDGARGGKGEEGIRSLGLVMGGLEAGGKGGTVRIEVRLSLFFAPLFLVSSFH